MKGKCKDCAFFKRTKEGQGDCHRYPPQLLWDGDGSQPPLSWRPETQDGEFCGEHQPNEAES